MTLLVWPQNAVLRRNVVGEFQSSGEGVRRGGGPIAALLHTFWFALPTWTLPTRDFRLARRWLTPICVEEGREGLARRGG